MLSGKINSLKGTLFLAVILVAAILLSLTFTPVSAEESATGASSVGSWYDGLPSTAEERASLWQSSVEGEGTESNPYLIDSAADLALFSAMVNDGNTFLGKYLVQTADIDLSGKQWIAIGGYVSVGSSKAFLGNYNGGYYNVSNLTIDTSNAVFNSYIYTTQGLFGYVAAVFDESMADSGHTEINGQKIHNGLTTGVVRALNLDNVNIVTGGNYNNVGSVAGINNGLIEDCTVESGSVTASPTNDAYIGGIVGTARSGDMRNCFNFASVSALSGTSSVGGVAGRTAIDSGSGEPNSKYRNTTVFNLINKGKVTGNNNVGGIIGISSGISTSIHGGHYRISGLANAGEIYLTGGGNAGGLIGNLTTGNVSASYNIGTVSADETISASVNLGGLVGIMQDAIWGSYNYSTVKPHSASDSKAGNIYGTGSSITIAVKNYFITSSDDSAVTAQYYSGDNASTSEYFVNTDLNSFRVNGITWGDSITNYYGTSYWYYYGAYPRLSIETLETLLMSDGAPAVYDNTARALTPELHFKSSIFNVVSSVTLKWSVSGHVSAEGTAELPTTGDDSWTADAIGFDGIIKEAGDYFVKIIIYSEEAGIYSYADYSLTIDKRPIYIKGEQKNITYGTADDGIYTYTVVSATGDTGLLSGHAVEGELGRENPDATAAGEYAYDYSAIRVLDGETDLTANYNLIAAEDSGKFVIDKKALGVTVNDFSLTYGGTVDSLASNFSAFIILNTTGVAEWDKDKVKISAVDLARVDASPSGNVGTYANSIKINSVLLNNANYTVNINYSDLYTLIINPASLSVEFTSSVVSKTAGTEYDLSDLSLFGYTLKGLVSGDTAANVITVWFTSDGASSAAAAGSYDIVFNYELKTANYAVTTPDGTVAGTLNVSQANVTVKDDFLKTMVAEKVYDGTVNGNLTGPLTSDLFTNWQEEYELPSVTVTFDSKNVGTGKTVTVTLTVPQNAGYGIVNSVNNKYTLTVDGGVITPRAVTVSIKDITKNYGTSGDNYAFTYAFGGADGIDLSAMQAEMAGIMGSYVSLLGREEGSDVGRYLISWTAGVPEVSADNYAVTVSEQTAYLEILPANINISGTDITAADKVYDGSTDVSVTVPSIDNAVILADSGKVYLEIVSASFAAADAGSDKPVSVTIRLAGEKAGNYTLSQTEFTVSADIAKRGVTVTFDNAFSPSFGYVYDSADFGLVLRYTDNGELITDAVLIGELTSHVAVGLYKDNEEIHEGTALSIGSFTLKMSVSEQPSNHNLTASATRTVVIAATRLDNPVFTLNGNESTYVSYVYGETVTLPVAKVGETELGFSGSETDSLTYSYSVSSVAASQGLTPSAIKNAGTYTITLEAEAKDGYTFKNGSYRATVTYTLEITKKTAYVAVKSLGADGDIIQGDDMPDFASFTTEDLVFFSIVGDEAVNAFVYGEGPEVVSGTFVINTKNIDMFKVGTYQLNFASFDLKADNYNLVNTTGKPEYANYIGTITVGKNENTTVSNEDNTVIIENQLTEGVALEVTQSAADDYEAAQGQIQAQEGADRVILAVYGIAMEKNGETFVSPSDMTIKLKLPSGSYKNLNSTVKVVLLDEEGNYSKMLSGVTLEQGEGNTYYAVFKSKEGGTFAIVGVPGSSNPNILYYVIGGGVLLIIAASVIAIIFVKSSDRKRRLREEAAAFGADGDGGVKAKIAAGKQKGKQGKQVKSQPAPKGDKQPVSQPVQQPVQRPVQQPAQRPVQQPAQRPVQQPAQRPVQQPAQRSVQQPVQRPAAQQAETQHLTPEQRAEIKQKSRQSQSNWNDYGMK